MQTSRIYYVKSLGSFYTIEHKDDGFAIMYQPAEQILNNYLTAVDTFGNWERVGYMGNDPGAFDTVEQARAFIMGLKFAANL